MPRTVVADFHDEAGELAVWFWGSVAAFRRQEPPDDCVTFPDGLDGADRQETERVLLAAIADYLARLKPAPATIRLLGWTAEPRSWSRSQFLERLQTLEAQGPPEALALCEAAALRFWFRSAAFDRGEPPAFSRSLPAPSGLELGVALRAIARLSDRPFPATCRVARERAEPASVATESLLAPAEGLVARADPRDAPYFTLGLVPPASPAAVRSAYRALARLAHPDAGGSHGAFLSLQDAYRALQAR